MVGMRCDDCGEVRWSIFGRAQDESAECPACGAAMVAERRQPGRHVRNRIAERRDSAAMVPPVKTA